MDTYPGITKDAMWLLAENRFHDSRAFYEEQKPQIKRGVLDPLRCLLDDLAPTMRRIDPQIVIGPTVNGCISRIRRDNRYTHDKSMYRENVWIAFQRDKRAWDCLPGFFADMSLRETYYGLGFYQATPRMMQVVRRLIAAKPRAFQKAARQALDAGFAIAGDRYARPKVEGLPPLLDELANRKTINFEKRTTDPAFFEDPGLPGTLRSAFTALTPVYALLIEAVETELAERGKPEA